MMLELMFREPITLYFLNNGHHCLLKQLTEKCVSQTKAKETLQDLNIQLYLFPWMAKYRGIVSLFCLSTAFLNIALCPKTVSSIISLIITPIFLPSRMCAANLLQR